MARVKRAVNAHKKRRTTLEYDRRHAVVREDGRRRQARRPGADDSDPRRATARPSHRDHVDSLFRCRQVRLPGRVPSAIAVRVSTKV